MSVAVRFTNHLVHALLKHRVKDMSAQLAFWSLLALFPFMLLLITVMGYVPLQGIEAETLEMIYEVMPDQAARLFGNTLKEILGRQSGWLLAVSLVAAVWSSSAGMNSTSQALNLAHGFEETRPWWKRRVLGLVLTVGAVGSIVVATASLMIGPTLVRKVMDFLELGGSFNVTWKYIRVPLAIVVLLMQLDLLYYFLPNGKLRFRLITPGALVAVGMWIGASLGFNYYVAHIHSYTRTYGTLGTPIILLLWLYLSALSVIVGAEINAVIEKMKSNPSEEPA